MGKLTIIDDYGVAAVGGVPVVSSRRVADAFGKRHDNVLQAIANCGCSPEFTALNFKVSSYKDATGRRLPEYLLTKDGFTFIAMGFTGKKAAEFKEAYIKRFNDMEQFIRTRLTAQIEYRELTDMIQLSHDPAKHYHYSNEADLINRVVLGMSAKQFREANGIEKDEPLRNYLAPWQIEAIQRLQKADSGLVAVIPDFQQRKAALQTLFDRLRVVLRLKGDVTA